MEGKQIDSMMWTHLAIANKVRLAGVAGRIIETGAGCPVDLQKGEQNSRAFSG